MSDDIDGIIVIVSEPPRRPPVHVNHWCEHEGCKRWGSFGYTTRYGCGFIASIRAKAERS